MTHNYCADCGESLVPGKPFCPSCGTAVAEGSGPQAPGVDATGAPGSPPSPQTPTPPVGVVPRLVGVVVGLALVATAGAYLYKEDPEITRLFDMVSQKIDSIITAKPPIGNITPVRDLRGTWRSSLSGKGFQLYGTFDDGSGTVEVYEEGDMELVIESMSGNTASGTMRMTNLYLSTRATVPGSGSFASPRTLVLSDSGANPMTIRVSGTSLDFGSFAAEGVSGSMQGSYTTDLISGTMTVQTEYGPIKGEFHLMRVE